MKLLIITACLLAYVATYPVSQSEDNKEIAETADKITESIDETLPPQNGMLKTWKMTSSVSLE